MVLIAGLMGFYTIFLDVSLFVKAIAIGIFMDCFYSCAPYESFTAYVLVVGGCYFYYLCSKIEDWSVIFKGLQSVVFLTLCLMVMQITGHDTILNWGLNSFSHYGILGQHMQEASFAVVICAFLILFNPLNFITCFVMSVFCHSPWSFLCAVVGCLIYYAPKYPQAVKIFCAIGLCLFLVWSFKMSKYQEAVGWGGRITVWEKSISLSNQRPLTGWGPGMYKVLFPILSKNKAGDSPIAYNKAHNFILQLLFETGYPITIVMLLAIGWMIFYLWFLGRTPQLAALVMIVLDSLVHFPDRQLQDILIIIAFLAFLRRGDLSCPKV